MSAVFSSGSLRPFQSTHALLWSGPWHRIGGMEQILTPSEPDKSLPLLAFFLFHSPLHLLSSRLICHYLFLSHSLSSPFCCCLSFHSLCVPVCQSLSLSLSSLLEASQAVCNVGSGLRSLRRDQLMAFSSSSSHCTNQYVTFMWCMLNYMLPPWPWNIVLHLRFF